MIKKSLDLQICNQLAFVKGVIFNLRGNSFKEIVLEQI